MKQSKRQATVFVIVFAVLFVLALTASYIILNITSNRTETIRIEVKDVSSKIISSSSKEAHVVDAEITVEITGKENKGIDANKISGSIRRIITELDYDKISEADGMEYIKSEIKDYLLLILPEETVSEIYFTTLVIDDPYSQGTGHRAPEQENDANQETMRGLFDKMGN